MKNSNKFSPEVRERAVRLVQEHHGTTRLLALLLERTSAGRPGARLLEDRRVK